MRQHKVTPFCRPVQIYLRKLLLFIFVNIFEKSLVVSNKSFIFEVSTNSNLKNRNYVKSNYKSRVK